MFRFIHAADVHLDSPLRGLERYEGAPVDAIRAASRRSLENLVQLALDREVDFVLIAGDLYDGDWKDHNTGLFFVRQMSRLRAAGIPVIAIAGNHDAASRMSKKLTWPENVEWLPHKRPGTARHPKLESLGVSVHGQSFATAEVNEKLVLEYPPAVSHRYNIGLLHTSLEGSSEHERYAPCTLNDLKAKDYDYWALGHIHQRQVVCESPWVIYSGNTQGRHIRETGAKGCYVVTVDEQGASDVAFETLDVIRWEHCEVDLTEVASPSALLQGVRHAMRNVRSLHEGMPLAIRVSLVGDCGFHGHLVTDWERWNSEIRAIAVDEGGDEIWVEQVLLRSRIPAQSQPLLTDGPLGEIRNLFQQMDQDASLRCTLLKELDDFLNRLPEEVRQQFNAVDATQESELDTWLRDAQALILDRLGATSPVEGAS